MSEIKKLLKEKSRVISLGKFKEAAEVCNAIGNELLNEEQYEEALEQHLEELEYCELTGDQLGIAVANRKIGESYANLCNFKKALHHIRKYYDICVSLNSVIEKQRAYSTFGRTYYLKYQYEISSGITSSKSKTLDQAELAYCRAFELLPKLISEIKPIEHAEMKCRLLLNWGLVNENRGEYESSINRVKQGLEIALKHHLYEDIQRCGLALGAMHQKIGNHLAADKSYDGALSAAKKLCNKNMMCEILLSKATNLISQENFDSAKKCLKSGYKLRTTNSDDYEKIAKTLKVCIGICNAIKKLKICQNYIDKKLLLESIADGLASINCFKLAIKKYLLTLKCMEEANATLSEKAPIYFSLAKSFLDDNYIPKALEYFEKEFSCNEDKPLEQIKTLWEIADVLEKTGGSTDKIEEIFLKANSIAERTGKDKILHDSLSRLISFFKSTKKYGAAEEVKKKLDNIKFECESDDDDETEESQNLFHDVDLSDLSDSDNNEEEQISTRKRTKIMKTKVNDMGETPLQEACVNGNLTMVKKLIENGHSVNVRDYCGWTPLHEACNLGFYDIVEYLLDKGANINDPGGSQCGGITALHDAASCGNVEVMRLLIDKGASVTVVDKNGETPLSALIQWKQRATDLDPVTLRQCASIEKDLKLKMQEAGMSINDINFVSNDIYTQNHFDINSKNTKAREKRARSPSLSPNTVSDDDNSEPPYLSMNDSYDCDDANNAKAEYRSVMKNLRRSAAIISPAKSQPKEVNGPPLLNENETVDEWLINDTKEIPKIKRKKRKFSRLNVRTSKRIDNYLISEDSTGNKDAHKSNIPFTDEDSNFSISSSSSTDKNMETSTSQAPRNENSKLSFCLRVHIADKLILVPVPDDSSTIGWLSEEASRRFQSLVGNKPHLILTKNGALLSGSDLIKNIFSNNEEVMSSVEAWDESSLEDRYVQLCAKRSTATSSSIRKRFQCAESSSELNISNCSIPPLHLSIIFSTLSNFKSLLHLNISGTALNESNMKELISCIPSFTILQTFNMSCCCLTSECLKNLTDYLKTSLNFLPALKSLDLSFNSFSSSFCILPLLNLSSLVSLNVSSCSLSTSLFSNQTFCNMLERKRYLEDFDISGNILGEAGISTLLCYLPKPSLRKINLKHTLEGNAQLGSKLLSFLSDFLPFLTELVLQGCYLTDTDVIQISLCLNHCPKLQICDLSANALLSQDSLSKFLSRAHESNLNITDLNITGTCAWQDQHFSILTDLLRFKTLRHLCIDNCSDSLIEKILGWWKHKWGCRAVCLNYGFCELSIV